MDFNKTLNINKRFVLIMLLVVGIVLISSYSYALFQVNFIKSNVVVLKSASNLNITTTIDSTSSDTFTLNANESKQITVHLTTNGITSAMAYKMYYELTGDGSFTVTSTETFTDDKVEGIMQPITKTGYDYKVTGKDIVLTFTNNSTNSLTIKLGAIGGFEKTGASLTNEEELFVNKRLPIIPNIPNNFIQKALETTTVSSDKNIKYYEVNGTNNGNGLFYMNSTKSDEYPIYFYRGNVENNNVYFAGYCWKIVRTTETGGTKMIYNGEPDIDGNTINCGAREVEWSTSTSMQSLNGTYKYGTGVTPNANGTYTLTGVQSVAVTSSTGADVIPTIASSYPYTCKSSSETCGTLYKVDSYKSTYYANVYTSVYKTQLAVTSAFNSSSKSQAYFGYSLPESSKRYSYSTQNLANNTGVYYGSGVDPTTYELVDPVLELNDTHHYSYNSTYPDATGISGDTGNVRYYYYKDSANTTSGTGYFIKFDKTKSVSTILAEMLTESNSKNNPSTIQGVINTWWGTGDNSLNSKYGKYLEDTEWCNDRSIASYGGWSPTGTLYGSSWNDYNLIFNERVRYDQSTFGSNANNIKNTNTPILTCSRPVDRLTVANGNLTYRIGLLTYDEVALAGARWSNGNSNFYLYTGQNYWLLSPSNSATNVMVSIVSSGGVLSVTYVSNTLGVRPALSLAPGTSIIKGDGSSTNPYTVE